MKHYLILDIGGTKTTTVVFTENGTPITDFFVTSSRAYEGEEAVFQNTMDVAYKTIQAAGIDRTDIAGIGVAAPGPMDYKKGLILDAPMMGWKNFPLGDRIRSEFGVPVYVENDGNLGALAEANLGVAVGKEAVLYQTISTGCGGGIAINGRIYHGHSGFAGEFGHETINFSGIPCGCGGFGCFETYASGTAVNRRMQRDMEKGIKSLAFESIGYDSSKINGKILGEAAEKGDSYALAVLRQEGFYIGVGLANLMNLFDPDVIVLAGGMMKSSKWFWTDMINEMKKRTCFDVDESRVCLSELNDRVVAYGAYYLIKEAMEGRLGY
ncbi:MAG: ROK family protein [Lachnospiraceae bacterium]|nr:ROK family protein [Lachnospiraceae bacterium]